MCVDVAQKTYRHTSSLTFSCLHTVSHLIYYDTLLSISVHLNYSKLISCFSSTLPYAILRYGERKTRHTNYAFTKRIGSRHLRLYREALFPISLTDTPRTERTPFVRSYYRKCEKMSVPTSRCLYGWDLFCSGSTR
jgi:hypothetical protein